MADDIPFYLMPIAAVLGTYSLLGGIRILYLIYKNLTKSSTATTAALPPSLSSRSFWTLLITVSIAILSYGRVVASVNHALASSSRPVHFDPYELLQLPSGATNVTEIKQSYRRLSRQYHPDKQKGSASEDMFRQIHLAYKALTDETAKRNYRLHGHPDGPLSRPSLDFALPEWLLHPQGNVALILVVLYLGLFVTLIVFVVKWVQRSNAAAAQAALQNSVDVGDVAYLVQHLSPASSHFDVLMAIATTPETVRLTEISIDKVEEIKAEREKRERQEQEKLKRRKDVTTTLSLDDLGEDGWADEEEEDEAALKEKAEEELRKKEREQLAEATGQKKVLLEGVDDGVLGQKWVESTLSQAKQWPPKDLGIIKDMKFDYKGKSMSAMDHPAIRRNLCMTMGRLNAILLNGHVDLLEAGSKGLVDQTYFKQSQEYRQRVGMLLDAVLRVVITAQSYFLAKTIVETISMFKIGVTSATEPKKVEWFVGLMKKQYLGDEGVPKLHIDNLTIVTPGEDEIATGDTCAVEIEIERLHAENWTKKKTALCQAEGIPPEVALQAYREGWWVLVRAKKLDGPAEWKANVIDPEMNSLLKLVDRKHLEKFQAEKGENRLLTAWPMVVQNVRQRKGKVKIQCKAPDTPGKYRFLIDIKSQEFLGADQSFSREVQVLDAADIQREEDEDQEDEDGGDAEETKKEQ